MGCQGVLDVEFVKAGHVQDVINSKSVAVVDFGKGLMSR